MPTLTRTAARPFGRQALASGLAALAVATSTGAQTFTIGTADGSFESDLSGFETAGDVRLVPNFGVLFPTEGIQAALLTTEPDAGAAPGDADESVLRVADFQVPAGVGSLRLDYVFLTDEPRPSFANDHFTVTLVLVGDGSETLLVQDTFDTFFAAPWTGYARQTGFRGLVADLSAQAGDGNTYTLELRLADVGDGRGNSAVLLDRLEFADPGTPEAASSVVYVEAAPGEAIRFDASGSGDDGSLTEYRWDFGNGVGGFGPVGDYAYDEEGIYQGTLTVTDDTGSTDSQAFTVVIGATNHAPSIVSSPNVAAAEGVPYVYQVVGDDPDLTFGDSLTYALGTAPAGMSIDPATGRIDWLPPVGGPRKNPVSVEVTDSGGLTAVQSFEVTIGVEVYAAVVDDNGRFYTARSNGDGSFGPLEFIEDTGSNTRGAAVADFDGDGDFDVITGHQASPSMQLYFYERAGGRFEAPAALPLVGDSSRSTRSWVEDMAAGDYDNDGEMDVVVSGDSEWLWLLHNVGELTFAEESFFASDFETGTEGWGGAQCRTGMALDTATAFQGSRSLRVDATGTPSCLSVDINPSNWWPFAGPRMRFAYRIPSGVPVGMLFNVENVGWVFLGGAPAAEPGSFPVAAEPVTLVDDGAWHEVDVDLYRLIKQSWPNAGRIYEFQWWTDDNAVTGQSFWFDDFRVTRRTVASGFAIEELPSIGGNGRGMDAGDVNGDANLDFARGRTSSGYVYLYTGDGDANFTPSADRVADPGNDPYGVLLADFDNDGRVDLIANNNGSGDPYFYKGNGNGSFQAGVYIASLDTDNYTSLGAYDFDNDGDQDVVAASYTSRQVWYYPGNGDATFGARVLIGNPSGNALGTAAPIGRVVGQPFGFVEPDRRELNEGESVAFDAGASYDDTAVVGYQWDFGDGTGEQGAGLSAVSHTYPQEGVYKVILTVVDGEGKQDRDSVKVTVFGDPPTALPGGPYAVTEEAAAFERWVAHLDGSGSFDPDTSITRYEWDFDDGDGIGVDSVEADPRHVYTAAGVYTVTLTVYDEVGQSHTATTTVTVVGNGVPSADLAAPATVGEAQASLGEWTVRADLTGSGDDLDIARYQVDWGDGSAVTEVRGAKDDFEDGDLTVNPQWTVSGGSWSVVDGKLQQSATNTSWMWLHDRTLALRDFELEVDFEGVGGSGEGYMGIAFRNRNNSAASTDTLLLYSRDQWDAWRFYDWRVGTTLAEGGGGWDPGIRYHLRLRMAGGHMQLYVTPEGGSEALVLEADRGDHQREGSIALLANAQALIYDNLVIRPIEDSLRPLHGYTAAGDYTLTLTALDHAGQQAVTTHDLAVTAGAPPLAAAGGDYLLDEHDAYDGVWDLVLDAGGGSDDTAVERVTMDFGDGRTMTTSGGDGSRALYFAAGTDLYGYDVPQAYPRYVVASEDNTLVELIDLSTSEVVASTTLDRLSSWSVNPGDGTYFKLRADKPVVAYHTDGSSHSTFAPSLDDTPVGRELVLQRIAAQGYYVFALEDARVRFFDSGGTLRAENVLRAGQYWEPRTLSNTRYRVVASGRIAIQSAGNNGYTTVPAAGGDGAGREFLFAVTAGTTGAVAVFAHQAANVELLDLDDGTSLHTAAIPAGEVWFQNGLGDRRLRLVADADVEVWAGDTEGGTAIQNLGDDISVAGGKDGTEFVLHTLADGFVVFAPNADTVVDIDGGSAAGGVSNTLGKDGYWHLTPADLPGGANQAHRLTASRPVVIQTLGRANAFNDLGTYLGGVTARHRYTAVGDYPLTVTAVDRAGQTHSATALVSVTQGDPPQADIDAPADVGEAFATGGEYGVDFDATGSTDDSEIIRYEWDFGDGTTGTGATTTHIYTLDPAETERPFTVTLTVTDRAGQQNVVSHQVLVKKEGAPQAVTGGPYVFGEEAASYGVWTAPVDATGSTDDVGLYRYLWEFEPDLADDFAGTVLDGGRWLASNDGVVQNDNLVITGTGSWTNRYLASVEDFFRRRDRVFEARLRTAAGGTNNAMVGWKNDKPDDFNYTQMPYALYFNNGTLRIYEDGSSRASVGSFVEGDWYDVRIRLKEEGGAVYSIKPAAADQWTELYDSDYSIRSPMKVAATVNGGTLEFDFARVRVVTEQPVYAKRYTAPGVYSATLTVWDNALQSHSESTTITIEGTPPTAVAGGPYTAEVGSLLRLDGTASTDAGGGFIQSYHWVFGDRTGGTGDADLPYTGQGPRPEHFYRQAGSYTATLTVTDNAGLSDSADAQVQVIVGDAPSANAGGPYTGGEGGPPVYFHAGASSDDYGIVEYRWDFDADEDRDGDGDPTNDLDAVGMTPFHTYPHNTLSGVAFAEPFDGAAVDPDRWTVSAEGVSQNDALTVTGRGAWGQRFAFSADTLLGRPRSVTTVTAVIQTSADSNTHAMWGIKNADAANGHYSQFPHALYLANGNLVVYENGNSRGTVGSYTRGETYAVRIDVKPVGADYFIRPLGAATWTPLTSYSSRNLTDRPLRVGIDVHSGTWTMDDVRVEGFNTPYLATLTVEDGAGQTATAQAPVQVAHNLAPDVIAVPWVASDPIAPHETYNGRQIHLKAIVRDSDPVSFQWDFGDGTSSPVANVTNAYDLSVTHTYPDAPAGTPFVARITVWDADGNRGEDTYNVVMKDASLTTRINVAIDEGLWSLHRTQNRTETGGYPSGYWDNNGGYAGTGYKSSPTASALQAFQINGHLETGDHGENPYAETVDRGLKHLFSTLRRRGVATQTYGEPDTNGNGIGIEVAESRPPYSGGQAMDAIVSTNTPLARTLTGADDVERRRYFDIVTDMADMYADGQHDGASVGGGWRYNWGDHPDNSVAQWGAIGLIPAEQVWGIPIPDWVKERNDVWLRYSYDGTGFGYTGAGNGRNTTPSGLVQLPLAGRDVRDSRWMTAENYIASQWNESFWYPNASSSNRFSYYGYYAFTKAMRLALPEQVVELRSTGLDWYSDPDDGIARRLVDRQSADGSWPRDTNPGGTYVGYDLTSAWSVIMLTPSLFQQPPKADAGRDRVWAVDREIVLDGSDSFHLDPFRDIVKYEWDFTDDGVYDYAGVAPTVLTTYTSADYPQVVDPDNPTPVTVTARLRVTDNNVPPLTDTDTVQITIAVPPHPPVADAGGPYTCTQGLPCPLDGSGSFADFDPTDVIARWEWDLDGFPFDYTGASGERPAPVLDQTGLYNIGLRVWDNGVLNDLDNDGQVDEDERLSDVDFSTVTVVANLGPTAAVSGPHTLPEGATVTLDASGSSDPNGDPLLYAWDLDDDGDYDDAGGVSVDYLGRDDGVYPVAVQVTDTLLFAAAGTSVTVQNVAPSVTLDPVATLVEGGNVSLTGAFTDPGTDDTHTASVDWGDGSPAEPLTVTEANGSGDLAGGAHTYAEDGSYTVTVTVTDDDGGVGIATTSVTVNNAPPVVEAGADQGAGPGQSVHLDPATFTDAGLQDTHAASVDWGDGSSDTGSVSEAGGSGSVSASHAYAAAGSYTVTVTVTDDDGGVGSDTLEVVVSAGNLPPVADPGGPYSVDEGSSVTLDGGASYDPEGGPIVGFEWDLDGDGQHDDASGATADFGGVDDGVYPVDLRVSDGTLTGTAGTTVTVHNVAPSVEAGPDVSVEVGQGLSLAPATFTDPGVLDTHTASVDWGDGNVTVGVVSEAGGNGEVAASHAYAAGGIYTVTVTVDDADGGTGSDTFTATVQPSAPTELTARAKSGKVQLVWDPVAGADYYRIYRSTVAGGPYQMIADGHVTDYATYLDEGLTNGVTYYYVVETVSAGIPSALSVEVSATPTERVRRR